MAELSAEQWTQAKRLFARAAELPPEQRASFLERECPDEDVLQEVASLLEHSGSLPTASEVIASVAAAVAVENDPDQWLIGARLGPYRVMAVAGHGGMGAVYRAERDDAEFHQQVAIKLVRAAASSPSTLQRFKQERQILARLSHPHIARLLDGGSTPEGVPYLVMEFIEGEPVTAWCERQSLKLEDRLRLFLHVCEGVEHAHHSLIVHRDLKPANILVTQDGTPKLLDFGIAKLLDASADAETATKTGLNLMTPDYASPEQVRGEPVTPAADVYALGLILYELLTGEKAHKIPEYTPATIAKVVCQTEAPAPASLRPHLAGDLDNIIRMALRKEAERRYRSAGELGRDIQRHLDGRPVAARRDTLAYRVNKFIRRNRVAVAAGVVVLASLAGGLALSLAARFGAEKRIPRVARVTQLTQFGRADMTCPLVTDGARIYFTEQQGGSWWLAQIPVEGGASQPLPVLKSLRRPEILDISPDRATLLVTAGDEEEKYEKPLWVVPTAGGAPRQIGNLLGHSGTWSRDGTQIVFARALALYRVNRDGTDCRKLLDTPGLADFIRWAPAPGPDVLRFNTINAKTQSVALWEAAADGKGLHPLLRGWKSAAGFPDGERAGIWTPSGKYYVFASRRSGVSSLWAMRERVGILPAFDISPVQIYSTPLDFVYLAANSDGKRIFLGAAQQRRELMRYDRKLRQFLPYLPGIGARWVTYSKDGRWVAYVTYPEGMLWRSRPDGREPVQLTPNSLTAVQPHWSPDGTRIVFNGARAGLPNMAYVIPAAGGAPQVIASTSYLEGSPNWSPDGKSLVFGGFPFAHAPVKWGICMMDWATRNVRFLPGSEQMSQPVWSPDGRYLAAYKDRAQLMLLDLGNQQWTPLAAGSSLVPPYWSRDGKYVYYQDYTAGSDQPISRVQISSRKVERMMSMKQIPQSNVNGYFFGGLAPDDAPIIAVIRTNSDIYALDLELP